MIEEATRIPGFCAAYTAGSTNWLPDHAELNPASDLDIMVVLTDQNPAGRRDKFLYHGALLEISYLRTDQFQSAERVLSDYHLAPSFRTTKILFDPMGQLTPFLAPVSREYAQRRWVRQRCANATDKVLAHLRPINEKTIDEKTTIEDQVIACLFAAGVTTHVLLVAGLKNPTVRTRYVAVRDLLADYGQSEFYEALLQLLGSSRLSRERARHHLATLVEIFDTAKKSIKTPFPFASDISDQARAVAVDGSMELIARGFHREAMFWIGVTHSRCQKVLLQDEPERLTQSLKDSYRELLSDLGMSKFSDVRKRGAEIERMLPRVCDEAEKLIAANREIKNG